MYFSEMGGGGFFGGFDIMFTIIPLIVMGGFIFVIGSIIYNAVNVAKDKRKPIIPVNAKIVSRRTEVYSHNHHDANNHMHHSSRTNYYVTFEFDNGERMEFEVADSKYGYLVEGDRGILSFQGNLFVDFKRNL